jgi:alkylhydroperoxidase/carboxymuconolactone decarboxylase family protein YurZ
MAAPSPERDFASLEEVISDSDVVTSLRAESPASFAAASEFWRVPTQGGPLSPRMTELILLAMHATSTALNVQAIERHIVRALAAGATAADIADVLLTIVGAANHALYETVPILEEELEAAGIVERGVSEPDAEFEAAKEEFIATRGFWNPDRDVFARLMPDYFRALNGIATESWKNGSLSAKEREFVCIGIDCTVTHVYETGLRQHIRNALGHGATRAEVLQIFQLAALLGLEGYVVGARALFGRAKTS